MKRREKNLLKKLKREKGVTLVALVITIVILIILATVTINVAFGERGLIERAQQAKNLTEQATRNEQEGLNSLMSEYANIIAEGPEVPEPEPVVNEVDPEPEPEPGNPVIGEDVTGGSKFENITTVEDGEGNEVTIPGGFELAPDTGTKVEEGIVIQDSNGNQFVWIPVGTYQTSSGAKTNNLSRRTFTSSGATEVSVNSELQDGSTYTFYGEENPGSIAYNQIQGFKDSATSHGGFYIGRYEQGTGNVCKAGINPYVDITRDQAKTQAEAIYSGNSYVTSELISSYAWDTALNFICQTNSAGYTLATTTSSSYGNIDTENKTLTGNYEKDKYSNIFDFLGNCYEWTTEYCNHGSMSWVTRGGRCITIGNYAAYRNASWTPTPRYK